MSYQVLGKLTGFKGINADFIPEALPPKDAPVYITGGDNILIKDGMIEKLKGTDYLNDVSTQLGATGYRTVLGLPIYKQYDDDKFLMAVTPTKLYYLQSNTTWTELGSLTDGTNDSVLSWTNIDNKFVFSLSDSGYVYYWDGSTFATLLVPGTLKGRFLLEFESKLFLFRTVESGTEHYQRAKWSSSGAITTFPAANALDLEIESKILGALQIGDVVAIYFDNAIYVLYYLDSATGYVHKPLFSGKALLAPKTLCGDKDIHFFLSAEGLMTMERGSPPRSLSHERFNSLILDEIDPVNYKKATAYYYSHLRQLFLAYPSSGSTYNDIQLIVDPIAGELISKKTLVSENYCSYGEFEKDLSTLSPDERKNYGLSIVPIIGNTDGEVKEQKIVAYQDGTYNYESNLIIPPLSFKAPDRYKRILRIDIIVEKLTDEDITFGVDIANEANDNFSYNFTLTGDGNTGIRRYTLTSDDSDVGLDVSGYEFKAKIKDSDNPYGWKFHSIFFMGWYRMQK